jgi:hypothetical protein
MAVAVSGGTHAGARRLFYGFNTAVQITVALVLLIFAVYFGQRYARSWDLSRTGVNSLSPSTLKLLSGLNEKIRITALYGVDRKSDTQGEKRLSMVRDLLALYDKAGREKVDTFVFDPTQERSRVVRLLQELREKPAYKDESRPHQEALDKAPAVAKKVTDTVSAELAKFDDLQTRNQGLKESQGAAQVRAALQTLQREAQTLTDDLESATKAEVPLYGELTRSVNQFAQAAAETLRALAEWGRTTQRTLATGDPDMQDWVRNLGSRLQDALSDAEELAAATRDLKPVKLESIYRELSQPRTILVESEREAFVVSSGEVWPMRMEDAFRERDPNQELFDFAGEAAVSSAILRLTQKEKTAVIFTRYGGTTLLTFDSQAAELAKLRGQLPPSPPLAQLAQTLRRANFETAEWDVQSSETPPTVENVSRRIFFVFPPPPQQQRNQFMPPTEASMPPDMVKRVTDAVDESGMAVFLSGWQPGNSAGPGRSSALASYPYALYLEQVIGVVPEVDYRVVPFIPSPRTPELFIPTDRAMLSSGKRLQFTEHEIAQPIQSLPVTFALPCPLRLIEPAPKDVTRWTLAESPKTDSVWAVRDVNQLENELRTRQGATMTPDDIASPFPLAVAAARKAGDKEHRFVVFGDQYFAIDEVAMQKGITQVGAALVLGLVNPGNTDLIVNTMHWVAGNADRIAIGPRSADVPRLTGLKDGAPLNWSRAFMVGIWPGTALAVGLVVSFFRRR